MPIVAFFPICDTTMSFTFPSFIIGRVALSKDRLLFGKSFDLSTAVEGRKECLGIELTASETYLAASQDSRKLLSDARADPRLMSGTMTNSRTATPESSTPYSSTSWIVLGGLKFHCWRTTSRN
jgi:hypothetical protein